MKRLRSPFVWLPVLVLVALAVTTAVGWRSLRARGLDRPIEILSVTSPHDDGKAARAGAERKTKRAGPPLGALAKRESSEMAPLAVRRLEGPALIAELERTTTLSPRQRARITSTLELAATMQKEIDRVDDLDARMDLQSRLDDQVRTRLEMILPSETLAALDE
jgi:hypothetical protein